MDQNFYRNLVSGADSSFAKRLLRFLLGIVSAAYRTAMALRNFCYDKHLLRSYCADVPVISVGNITTGGTGKTPLVIWLCGSLGKRSIKCTVLTRGYKTQSGKLADEPAIIAKSCPAAKVIVSPDRVSAANKAVKDYDANILVMDDGFQHRKLRRDLDIVAIDATCPFGYGRMLPAGLLREPAKALRRADAVVITRYDQATAQQVEQIEKDIEKITPGITIAKATHKHPYARMIKGETLGIAQLKEKAIFAFCGVGNPNAFLNHLKEFGLNVVGSKIYNDHHNYTQADIMNVYEEAKGLGADLILSTQKDWIKTALLSQQNNDILFAYLALELEFIDGADRITALIEQVLGRSDG